MTSDLLHIAVLNDYEIVLAGIRGMLQPYSDKVTVVEFTATSPSPRKVDIVLYDTQGEDENALSSIRAARASSEVERFVLYTWNPSTQLLDAARSAGVDGVLSKTMAAEELVTALQLIAKGQRIYSPETGASDGPLRERRGTADWPGRAEGLTMREAEMITLISQGLSNAEIATSTFLSPNSVKSYIRSAYRKIGVQRRSQAVAWGIDHGMVPDKGRQVL